MTPFIHTLSFEGTKNGHAIISAKFWNIFNFNSLVQKLPFELCTESIFYSCGENVCPFYVSDFWVFFQFFFWFLHLTLTDHGDNSNKNKGYVDIIDSLYVIKYGRRNLSIP